MLMVVVGLEQGAGRSFETDAAESSQASILEAISTEETWSAETSEVAFLAFPGTDEQQDAVYCAHSDFGGRIDAAAEAIVAVVPAWEGL